MVNRGALSERVKNLEMEIPQDGKFDPKNPNEKLKILEPCSVQRALSK